jgi:hypothetical protein
MRTHSRRLFLECQSKNDFKVYELVTTKVNIVGPSWDNPLSASTLMTKARILSGRFKKQIHLGLLFEDASHESRVD